MHMGQSVDYRSFLKRALWSGAGLTIVLGLALVAWAWLGAMDDSAGAAGAKGVACVAGLCWLLDFAALVVLSALTHVATETADDEVDDEIDGEH